MKTSPLFIGSWRVDPASREVTDGTHMRRLSPRAIGVLLALHQAAGEAVSRHDLLDTVWPDVTVGDESLTQAVAEVRRAMTVPAAGSVIETIPKFGYRLGAALNQVAPPPGETNAFHLASYQLCLEARAAMNRGGPDAILASEDLAHEAVMRAPSFAFARAEYATALCYRWLYQRDDEAGLDLALEQADYAVRLGPDQGTSYAAQAFALGALGRVGEAQRALERGFSIDRDDPDLHFLGARMLFAAREYACATILAERAATLRHEDYWPLFFAARTAQTFDPARARRNAEVCLRRVEARVASDPSEPRARNLLGPLYAMLGDKDRALAAIEAQGERKTPLQFYDVVAMATLGHYDRAIDNMGEVVERGWRHGDWLAAEPAFTSGLRGWRSFRHATRAIGTA